MKTSRPIKLWQIEFEQHGDYIIPVIYKIDDDNKLYDPMILEDLKRKYEENKHYWELEYDK